MENLYKSTISMNINEALQFLKVTIEQNAIAIVRALKSNIFTVKLSSNKVEITNPTKIPKQFDVKVVNSIDNKKDLELQTRQLNETLNKKFTELNNLVKTLYPKSEIKINNLGDIPKPLNEVSIKNPVKTVSISNFFEIQKEIGKLQKAIEALKLDPKIIVPEIKIPEIVIPKSKVEVILDKRETLISDDPKKSVPVRLTDGKKFYQALEELAIRSSGGAAAFSDSTGIKQQALVDKDRHLQVDVVGMPNYELTVDTSQLATSAKQDNIVTAIENITIPETGLVLTSYDYMSLVLTNSTTKTYTYKTGGALGTTTNTVVVVYTDNTLNEILTVTKT